MYLPKKIKIKGTSWKIKLEKNPTLDGRAVYGYCSYETYTIVIAKGMPLVDTLETLIHEYMHACGHEAGSHDEEIPSWVEHLFVNAVAKDMRNNASLWEEVFSSYVSERDSK